MKTRRIALLIVLGLLWAWLSAYVLMRGGITLKNILVVIVAGGLILYPMMRRYGFVK